MFVHSFVLDKDVKLILAFSPFSLSSLLLSSQPKCTVCLSLSANTTSCKLLMIQIVVFV